MRIGIHTGLVLALGLSFPLTLHAANEPPDPLVAQAPSNPTPSNPARTMPSAVVDGAHSVTIGGRPAARQGDNTGSGAPLAGGSANVIINGRPAATVGSQTECGGTILSGSSSVFINGKPVATSGSAVSPCPR